MHKMVQLLKQQHLEHCRYLLDFFDTAKTLIVSHTLLMQFNFLLSTLNKCTLNILPIVR